MNKLDFDKAERVRRQSVKPNDRLKGLGKMIGESGWDYVGSFAVHIYVKGSVTGSHSVAFQTQVAHGGANEHLAQLALTELANATMTTYGVRPRRKRGDKHYEQTVKKEH